MFVTRPTPGRTAPSCRRRRRRWCRCTCRDRVVGLEHEEHAVVRADTQCAAAPDCPRTRCAGRRRRRRRCLRGRDDADRRARIFVPEMSCMYERISITYMRPLPSNDTLTILDQPDRRARARYGSRRERRKSAGSSAGRQAARRAAASENRRPASDPRRRQPRPPCAGDCGRLGEDVRPAKRGRTDADERSPHRDLT
jgi:hypothetical protein